MGNPSNTPDDWGMYNTVCPSGHRYHMSEGGCAQCDENADAELWGELLEACSEAASVDVGFHSYSGPSAHYADHFGDTIHAGETEVTILTGTLDEYNLSLSSWRDVKHEFKRYDIAWAEAH